MFLSKIGFFRDLAKAINEHRRKEQEKQALDSLKPSQGQQVKHTFSCGAMVNYDFI